MGMTQPVPGLVWAWARPHGIALLLAALVAVMPAAMIPGARGDRGPVLSVIVQETEGAALSVHRALDSFGATIERRLGIINADVVSVHQNDIPALRETPGVISVTGDARLKLLGNSYDAAQDSHSMYNVEQDVASRAVWNQSATGAGVDVALIDSGVTPVIGIGSPGQVVNGPDLTEESQNPSVAYLDTFGHGTFMAGIIAGRDPGVDPSTEGADTTAYQGVAPNARIVSVKVADAMGMTDVSQVIAAIDWVVQHAHDPGMNIRVINLSFGTDSTQSYLLDPLAFAVETAWRSGIVVVTSAGNAGSGSNGLTLPATDPYVIAVGAEDAQGTPSVGDDVLADFSSWGDGVRNPDVVAPGVHMQGLRVPGSHIDALFGDTAAFGDRYFRGSGTSQSAAVVSGAVAQLLQRRPMLNPDQIKGLLTSTASGLGGVDRRGQGAGLINVEAANAAPPPPGVKQNFSPAKGTGSLEGSRGSAHLVLRGAALTGERDIFGRLFDSSAMSKLEAKGSSWSGGTWNGSSWSGSSWSGSSWSGSSWSGSSWSGDDWTGSSWSSDNWSTGTWDGSSWSGSSWSGSSWSGSSWSGSSWSGSSWSAAGWT